MHSDNMYMKSPYGRKTTSVKPVRHQSLAIQMILAESLAKKSCATCRNNLETPKIPTINFEQTASNLRLRQITIASEKEQSNRICRATMKEFREHFKQLLVDDHALDL
jgi:hypothetical protein